MARWSKQLTAPALSGTGALTWEASEDEGGDIAFDTADSNELKYNQAETIRTVVNTDGTQTLTNKTLTAPVLSAPVVSSDAAIAGGSTLTLTAATHGGKVILMDTATGTVLTLPAATGSGVEFTIFVSVTPTSNTHDIVVVGDDEFVGALFAVSTTAGAADAFAAAPAGDNDTIQMNGSTEGGAVGSMIWLKDVAADDWAVHGTLHGIGATLTTPFLTAQVT